MLSDTFRPLEPSRRGRSRITTEWASGLTHLAVSAKWRIMAAVSQRGQHQARAFAVLGTDGAEEIAERMRRACGARGQAPRLAD